jgi:hypothetical protein
MQSPAFRSVALLAVTCWCAACGARGDVETDTKGLSVGTAAPQTSALATTSSVTAASVTAAASQAAPACAAAEAPCGGDVTGTYTVKACSLELTGAVDLSGLGLGCASGTTISGSLVVSGTWEADAEGTFWDNTTTQGVHEFKLPKACFDVAVTGSCASVGTPLRAALGYATAECVDDMERGGCVCTATIHQEGGMAEVSPHPIQTGSYTTEGTTLTTSISGVTRTYQHCALEDALELTIPTPGKIGQVAGSLLLQKE